MCCCVDSHCSSQRWKEEDLVGTGVMIQVRVVCDLRQCGSVRGGSKGVRI